MNKQLSMNATQSGLVGRTRLLIRGVAAVAIGMIMILVGSSVASASIYWTNSSGIGKAELDGSGVNEDFISASGISGITTDDTYVYWSNMSAQTIGRAKLDGSEVDQNFMTGVTGVGPLAVDDTYIYWGTDPWSPDPAIGRAPKASGAPQEPKFVTGVDCPKANGLAVADGWIFWTTDIGVVSRVSTSGGTCEEGVGILTEDMQVPEGITANNGQLFWNSIAEWAGYSYLMKSTTDGKAFDPEFLLLDADRTEEVDGLGIAADDTHLYWTTEDWTNYNEASPSDIGDSTTIGRSNQDGSGVDRTFISGLTKGARWLSVQAPASPDQRGNGLKSKQKPLRDCVAASGKLPLHGNKRLMKSNCRTSTGQRVGVKVSAGSANKGQERLVKLRCKVGPNEFIPTKATGYGDSSRYCIAGALTIRTFGKKVEIKVTWSTPKTTGFKKFHKVKKYKS